MVETKIVTPREFMEEYKDQFDFTNADWDLIWFILDDIGYDELSKAMEYARDKEW